MRLFKIAAEKIKRSPFIIPIGFVFILLFIESIGISFEDYSTSLYGYISLPTAKANVWIPFLVAALPQLIQIGFTYVFIDDTDKRWALLFVGFAHAIDLVTDVWFKINVGGSIHYEYVPLALLESWGIYTLGSEVLFTVSTGMLISIFPDFWREIVSFSKIVFGFIKPMITFFVPFEDGNKQNRDNDNRNKQNESNKVDYNPYNPVNSKRLEYQNNDKSNFNNQEKRPGRPKGSKNKNNRQDDEIDDMDIENLRMAI